MGISKKVFTTDFEDTFNVLQVIRLRPPETIERIEEMMGICLERERVART